MGGRVSIAHDAHSLTLIGSRTHNSIYVNTNVYRALLATCALALPVDVQIWMERVGTARRSVVSNAVFGEPPCSDGPSEHCQVFLSSKTVFSSTAVLLAYIQCGDARSSH